MTNNDTYKIALIIKHAIAIRDNSYSDEQPRGYSKTIRNSIEEAFEMQTNLPDSVIEIVYRLISHDWNGIQDWANNQLAISSNSIGANAQ